MHYENFDILIVDQIRNEFEVKIKDSELNNIYDLTKLNFLSSSIPKFSFTDNKSSLRYILIYSDLIEKYKNLFFKKTIKN